MSVKPGAPFNPTFKDSDGWTVTLDYQGRRMTVPFYMGSGHHGAEPDINSVVSALTLDGSGYWNAQGFRDWASEYGYVVGDPDQPEKEREARRIYKAVESQSMRFAKLLGPTTLAEFLHAENDI
jgi:hypothetical protein